MDSLKLYPVNPLDGLNPELFLAIFNQNCYVMKYPCISNSSFAVMDSTTHLEWSKVVLAATENYSTDPKTIANIIEHRMKVHSFKADLNSPETMVGPKFVMNFAGMDPITHLELPAAALAAKAKATAVAKMLVTENYSTLRSSFVSNTDVKAMSAKMYFAMENYSTLRSSSVSNKDVLEAAKVDVLTAIENYCITDSLAPNVQSELIWIDSSMDRAQEYAMRICQKSQTNATIDLKASTSKATENYSVHPSSPTSVLGLAENSSVMDSPAIMSSPEIRSTMNARVTYTDVYSFDSFYFSGRPAGVKKLYLALSNNHTLKLITTLHKEQLLGSHFKNAKKLYVPSTTEPDVDKGEDVTIGGTKAVYLLVAFAPPKGNKFSQDPSGPFASIPLLDLKARYNSSILGQGHVITVEKGTLSFFYKITKVKTEDIRLEKEGKGKLDKAIVIADKIGGWLIPAGISLGLQYI